MSMPHTLVHHIEYWARHKPEAVALHGRRGGQWHSVSWQEYWTAVREIAKGLIALGHAPKDCVAIVGPNQPEWVQYQFGIQAARGVPAPLYPNNTPEQIAYIADNARAKLAVCADDDLLERLLASEALRQGKKFERLLTFTDVASDDPRVMSVRELRELGRAQDDSALDRRLAELSDEETCLLIYTSGTTGVPKGVMLSHGGQLAVGTAVLDVYPRFREEVPYRAVSYLPLSHQAEQIATNINALLTGGEVTFCPRMEDLKEYLQHARPTMFLGVPRVWEKFQAALEAKLSEGSRVQAAVSRWARRIELERASREFRTGRERLSVRRPIARKLVADRVKKALGLDELELAVTGAAPMGESTLNFFASLGICVHDVYGMTETSGLATVTPRHRPVLGAVGKPLPGVEARVGEDGEIQLRGPSMTRGYLHMPDESAELYTDDGWLRTGDLGSVGEDGYLRITGRKKELLITAGGKNVAPVELENYLKAIDGVGQAMVVGDRKPYLAALLTLDGDNLATLAQLAGTVEASASDMAKDPKVLDFLRREIEAKCNSRVARFQTIKKFEVLGVDWTPDGGEMTPTMKLRRGPTCEKYAAQIEGLYAPAPRASPNISLRRATRA